MRGYNRSRGVVMIIVLVILMVVTLIGLSSVQVSSFLEQMARNATDSNTALRAAEVAMQSAELVVEDEVALNDYQANANGKYELQDVGADPRWLEDATWAGSNSVEVDYSDTPAKPRYIIEFVKTVFSEEDRLNLDNVGGSAGADRTQIFLVSAKGEGRSGTAEVILQSTYGKKF